MRLLLFSLLAATLSAQDPLSLRDAVKLGLRENRSIAAADAGIKEAEARATQARSGALPKVNYSESFTRSDNPVFVFGSLLTQHQFTEQNFRIGPLNRPDFLNNFQSLIAVEQTLYDAGRTRNGKHAAALGQQMSAEQKRQAEMDIVAGVTRAYLGAVLAAESLTTAEQAVRSAEADLKRAADVREAGMSTDVDVLSIRVHLAAVHEQRIRRAADLEVARAALNDALGLPLDNAHTLTTPLSAMPAASGDGPEVAVEMRPELRLSKLAVDLARTQTQEARTALWPHVNLMGAFEADRQRFVTRGSVNWTVGVGLRWNLFNGNADKAQIAAAGYRTTRAEAEQLRMGSAVQLQVRTARAALTAAAQRIEVARAAVAQSEESLRITQNRYAAGMSNVTDLLRTQTAVLESKTRYLAAIHDQRLAATLLEYAAGRLSADSEVLQ